MMVWKRTKKKNNKGTDRMTNARGAERVEEKNKKTNIK